MVLFGAGLFGLGALRRGKAKAYVCCRMSPFSGSDLFVALFWLRLC
jgi:hypothetical protein